MNSYILQTISITTSI